MRASGWMVEAPGAPLQQRAFDLEPGPRDVVVRVAGCGVCHTDLGFLYDGVPTRHPFPLVLGHEISGVVVEAGDEVAEWTGKPVIVPAVIPCGQCEACRSGRGSVCPQQIFPGNDIHGGFATHVCVPAHGLCRIPASATGAEPTDRDLATWSVVADAVSTPYQAVQRSGVGAGDLAVFVGAGGIGGFGVQIAAARGAHVVAIDVDRRRLDRLRDHGAEATFDVSEMPFKELRQSLRTLASRHEIPSWRWHVFETSGTPQGQETAFGLLAPGASLNVVGFTPRKVEIRLSNLMAFDATARGNWGCLPEHYPTIVDLVASGRVQLAPFVEFRALDEIQAVLEELHAHGNPRRVILTPGS